MLFKVLIGALVLVLSQSQIDQASAQQSPAGLESLKVCKGPVGSSGPPAFADNPAINCPDEFAWDLFIKLNRPADPNKPGEVDAAKKLGDPGDTVWESWKLRNDIFLGDGCKPKPWGGAIAIADATPRLSEPASKAMRVLSELVPSDQLQPFFDPRNTSGETRLNKAAFDFIVDQELYNVEGQVTFHDRYLTIDFPPAAREIKSAWRVLTEDELAKGARDRYHTAEHAGEVYGLTALHIITKDIPQWFWSTFEHAETPDVDIRAGERFADRYTNGGTNLPPEIVGTKWQNYRLKGSQTEYVDLVGEPTILANTIIERGFQATSSCVSCHAHAAIDGTGKKLPFFEKIVIRRLDPTDPGSKLIAFFTGYVGAPDPNVFHGPEPFERRFTQLDFMWSLASAQPKAESCP